MEVTVLFFAFFSSSVPPSPTHKAYYYNKLIIISFKKAVTENQERPLVKMSKVTTMYMLFMCFVKFQKSRSVVIASHTVNYFHHLLDLKPTQCTDPTFFLLPYSTNKVIFPKGHNFQQYMDLNYLLNVFCR